MAQLPTVDDLGPRRTPNMVQPLVTPPDRTGAGRAVARRAGVLSDIFQNESEKEEVALAKERDTFTSQKIRELLYDPEEGFANLSGRNAVDRYGAVSQELDTLKERALDGLVGRARDRAEAAIQSRIDSARQTVDIHTSAQRRQWLEGASAARVVEAQQSLAVDPLNAGLHLAAISSEADNLAQLNGWDATEKAVFLQGKVSEAYEQQLARLALTDPEMAFDQMQKLAEKGVFTPATATSLQAGLEPLAKTHQGRRLARAAILGAPDYTHRTRVDYAMGPARPNAPDRTIVDAIGKAAEIAFGPGARVVITSGEEDEGEQHGSNRHSTGHAADFRVYRPDGTLVEATSTDAAAFARAASSIGVKGIGFGTEYMGGQHFHMDLVEAGPGQDDEWGSGGNAMKEELTRVKGTAAGMSLADLYRIEDPDVRAAALREYEVHANIAAGELKQRRDAAAAMALDAVWQGEDLREIPSDVATFLGREELSALMSLQDKLAKKEPVVTDPRVYQMLTRIEATGGEQWRSYPLLEHADEVEWTELKGFIERQSGQFSPDRTQSIRRESLSTILSAADMRLRELGIPKSPDEGTATGREQARMIGQLTTNMLRWQERFVAQNERPPLDAEISAEINNQTRQFFIKAATGGFPTVGSVRRVRGKTRGVPLVSIDFGGTQPGPEDDLRPADLRGATVKMESSRTGAMLDVPYDVIELVALQWLSETREAPTVEDVFRTLSEAADEVEALVTDQDYLKSALQAARARARALGVDIPAGMLDGQ